MPTDAEVVRAESGRCRARGVLVEKGAAETFCRSVPRLKCAVLQLCWRRAVEDAECGRSARARARSDSCTALRYEKSVKKEAYIHKRDLQKRPTHTRKNLSAVKTDVSYLRASSALVYCVR